MSTFKRTLVLRVLGFLVLFVAGQWILRLGAREASLVEWECYGGECSTNDFAGAAPVLGLFVMFAAAYAVLPPGRGHLMFGVGLFLSAGATLVGLEEAVGEGLIERDGPAHFLFFGGIPTSTIEIALAVIAGFGLVTVAVLLVKVPHKPEPTSQPAPEPSGAGEDDEAARTARVIAQLTKLRESGEIDQATYDTAVAKLLK
ncbi:hypothetical protein [Phytomonospora endophytica]|uniref:SHOCT domain-containing protein n=1 Tax=Phytomonospora endophytica TaxID=714109 RepID=A0A841FDS9_9ACTN|nr:hypothetical protein [Phytomonospora endophytica]MBB6033974.1 hypothetical protein [Phytomonospora endophytica]GIG64505.1 hypothetical protein Pen01_08000 [Phytomonospora endophytica]